MDSKDNTTGKESSDPAVPAERQQACKGRITRKAAGRRDNSRASCSSPKMSPDILDLPSKSQDRKAQSGRNLKSQQSPKLTLKKPLTKSRPNRRAQSKRKAKEERNLQSCKKTKNDGVASPDMSFGESPNESFEHASPQESAAATRGRSGGGRGKKQHAGNASSLRSRQNRKKSNPKAKTSKPMVTSEEESAAGNDGTAGKSGRPSARAASKKYSPQKLLELYAKMTRSCPYCEHISDTRKQVKTHLLTECPRLKALPEMQYIFQKIQEYGEDAPKPNTYKHMPCPMDGLCYLSNLQYPPGIIVAPHNWFYVHMDFNTEKKGERITRLATPVHQFQKKQGKELRNRSYTDEPVHALWEEKVRQLIQNNELLEIVIPVSFWYLRADVFKGLGGKNHAGVIVMTISNGWVTKNIFYDSVEDPIYYKKAADDTVTGIIVNRLQLRNRIRLARATPYCNVVLDGCQGVEAFYMFQRFLGLPISHPPNLETVEFWKCVLFCCPPSDDMTGEEFDQKWKLKRVLNKQTPDEHPETDIQLYLQRQLQKISTRPEFSYL